MDNVVSKSKQPPLFVGVFILTGGPAGPFVLYSAGSDNQDFAARATVTCELCLIGGDCVAVVHDLGLHTVMKNVKGMRVLQWSVGAGVL